MIDLVPSEACLGIAARQEYTANGSRLGWLIDPELRRVHVFRTGLTVEIPESPEVLSGEPVPSGFVLDLRTLWEPGF